MSDFQTVKNKKGHQPAPTIKYASQHQQLTDMGFDSASITKALEKTQGDLEAATIILLGDEQPQSHAPKSEEFVEKESSRSNRTKGGADNRNHSKNSSTNHSNATTGGSSKQSKEENIKDTHHRMMATYKIAKCREPPSHDKRMCIYWHSVTDRRRNPFEYTYSCFDCPSMASTNECKDGDNCPHAHSMLEKMFHPELYKISVCQRTQRGDSCDRGILCAFAHNDLDLRIISPNATPKVPPPVDWKPTKPIPDSKQLKLILERIVTILKEVGSEGAGGTEIARKYSDRYHESMELEDENKEKYKFRDLVSLNPGVTIVPNRGGPLRYIFDENRFAAAAAAAAAASTESKSEEENKSSNSGSNDAQGLNTIRERLVEIIKSAGSEGILGSDLPKKYLELHGEKLGDVVNGESGLKMKLKDILASQSEISTKLFKLQPKYVYEGGDSKPSASATAPSSSISYSSIVGAKEPAHTAPTPAATTTTTHTSSAPAAPTPAPVAAPAPAPVAQPAPVASTPAERPTTASVVTAGKSYSSVAAKLRASAAPAAPAPAPAPAPTPAPAPSVIEQPKPVVVEVPPVNPVPSVSSAKAAVSHHEENVAAIVDDGAPSAEDPIFTEDNQSSSLDNRLNEKSSNAFNSPSSAAPEPLTYQSAFGYGSVSAVSTSDNGLVSNDNDIRKSAAEPLMGAPGLTKIHNPVNSSLDSYSSTLSTIADFHERLNLAQSQISSLQQTINKLTSDLHSKNQDFDGQTIQLRNVMQRLAEAENKTSNSDEHYKLQLKAKTDELSQKTREVSKSDEENRKLREERKGDLNQFFMNLSQIEDAINAMKCKDDTTAEKTRPEDVQELLQFRKALRTFLASLKLQLKQKFDLLTSVPKPLEIESNSISSSAAIQAPRYIPNPVNGGYDANYYALAGRTDAFASAYAAYPPQVDTGLCALPGCRNPGHFTCAGCQKVSYCGADHQRLHWGHHSLNCHN